MANYVAMDGPPGPNTATIDGPPGTICSAVSDPPWPQMVPLKLSLEMMSHSSYEVDLAKMDCVIII